MNEKIEQAFTTVAKVCAEHRGPLADHQVIQAALIALQPWNLPRNKPMEKEQRTKWPWQRPMSGNTLLKLLLFIASHRGVSLVLGLTWALPAMAYGMTRAWYVERRYPRNRSEP